MWLTNNGMKFLLPVLVLAFAFFKVDCFSNDFHEWQIITKSNFTSQIRLHPQILLFVTVPWSGESRTLMKEIARVLSGDQVRFGNLKLMVLYKNMDRMLADALGATHGTTIFFYHNTLSYRYSGKLRVQNILSSMRYFISLLPDELPLKSLTTPDELEDFLDSTDKAVLLFEFCGWTPILLAKDKKTTENGFGFSTDGNGTLAAEEEKDNMKGMGDDQLSCGIDNGYGKIYWPSQLTSVNNSFVEADNSTLGDGASCTLDEFKHFELFLQKFIPISREFFLPPERIRFGVVRERSLVPLLNIEEQGSWWIAVSYATCPSCLKVVREVDSLRTVLQTEVSPVLELEDDLHGYEATLPAKRPAILLFIDRSSDSPQIKTESQKALNTFRELAQQYEIANQISGQPNSPSNTLTESNRRSWSTLKQSRFPASEKLIQHTKMSVMIVDEGQQITLENLVPNLEGSSVQEILNYALKRNKEQKLSSLAKDAGFQLLSKDFNVKVVESLDTYNNEVHANQVLGELHVKGDTENSVELDDNIGQTARYSVQNEEPNGPFEAERIYIRKEDSLDKNSQSYSGQAASYSVQNEEPNGPFEAERIYIRKEDSLDKNSQSYSEPEHHLPSMGIATDMNENQKNFLGSFFFLDGQYRLLETLTGHKKMPSVVIIDPISQQHYVADELSVFNSSLLHVFISDVFSGRLSPYEKSATAVRIPISGPKPPFVNLDFRETDSIPLVTTRTFAEVVLGNEFDSKSSAWNKNVVVLFTNSWCGFCARAELVVREVYRAIKGFTDMKMNNSRKEKRTSTCDYIEDTTLTPPLIYMMDCTQNDCSLIVESTQQRDLYPLLVLFPAEKKNNTVVYEGDVAVSDIIKFLAAHGSRMILDLIMDKRLGFLKDQNTAKHHSITRNVHHEVVLKDRFQSIEDKHEEKTVLLPVDLQERPNLSPGCFLTATEKLQEVSPFDESKILVVKVYQGTGVHGLIINKQMNWESLEELGEGSEFLKQAPLYFGGPVVRRGMPLVSLTRSKLSHEEDISEVLPNVYFFDEMATHKLLGDMKEGNVNQTVNDFWFFLGYSSWGWDQLFEEVAQGAWNVSQAESGQLEWP